MRTNRIRQSDTLDFKMVDPSIENIKRISMIPEVDNWE